MYTRVYKCIQMYTSVGLFLLCFISAATSLSTFADKTNSSLHCELHNYGLWSEELEVAPSKHIITNDTGTGDDVKVLVYGSSITVSCKDEQKTFKRGVVEILGGANLEYNIFKNIKVSCSDEGVLSPAIFNTTTTWCVEGCAGLDFGEGYRVSGGVNSSSPDLAPMTPGAYSITCNDGYARSYRDTGGDTITCITGELAPARTSTLTCAPGCRDIATDIVPFIRGLYIDTGSGDSRNMVWPGAPYPTGVTVTFRCYGDDVLVGDDVITCGGGARVLGGWSEEAPRCQLQGEGGRVTGSLPVLVIGIVLAMFLDVQI